MSLAAIEFNDAALILARDARVQFRSPGYALIEGESLLTGEDAARQSRINPRSVSTRFWDRLGNDPVFASAPGGVRFAELARAHLSQIWAHAGYGVEGLILVVPGSFAHEQLGMLLGIAQQLSLPVCGMVDSAVAACRPPLEEGLVVHLDVHLHRAVITGITTGDSLRRVFHHSVEGSGLIRFQDAWIGLIATSFVRATRFDPLHSAQSEQTLYDHLPHWLLALESTDSLAIEMSSSDGTTHAIRLSRALMVEAVDEIYARLSAEIGALCGQRTFMLQLADGAARLPGLAEALQPAAEGHAEPLPFAAAALGALRSAAQITDGGWRNTLTTSLPRSSVTGGAESREGP